MINNYQTAMKIARFSIEYVSERLFFIQLVIGGMNVLLKS